MPRFLIRLIASAAQSNHRRTFTASLVCILLSSNAVAVENRLKPGKADAISRQFLGPLVSDFILPTQLDLEYEEVSIKNASGSQLRMWLIPANNATQTILFCMGNQGNISTNLVYAKILVDGGFNVAMFDYQGYGGSGGTASALSLYTDTCSATEYLLKVRRLPSKSIGCFGVSLGSALAVAATAKYELGAVAVEDILLPQKKLDEIEKNLPSDIASKLALATIRNVLLPQVDPIANAKRLRCPIFIMHGENDPLLPAAGSIELAEATASPVRLWLMDDAGHAPETLDIYDGEYALQLIGFFKDAFAQQLHVPQASFQSTHLDSHWNTMVEVECPKEGCYQIALASDKGEFHFIRRFITDRLEVKVELPFEPQHVSVLEFHQVDQSDRDQWTPKKTDLSRSLAEFGRFVGEFAKECPPRVHIAMNWGGLRSISYRTVDDLQWIIDRLPASETVHPRVRPRYAKLLARAFADLEPTEQYQHIQLVNHVIPYLPEEPDTYIQLDNAGFELQLRDEAIAGSLIMLAKNRYDNGQLPVAKELLTKAYFLRYQNWPNPTMVEALQPNVDFYRSIGSPLQRRE